jgi:hypothetical protein
MSKIRAYRTILAVLAVALLSAVAPTSSAIAQTGSAIARTGSADAATFSLLDNFQTNTCLVEHANNAPAYLDNCGPNHSFYWTFSWETGQGNATELINLHSRLCLTVHGTAAPVYVAKCGGNHAQLWYGGVKYVWAGGGKRAAEYTIVNDHTGLCLWWTGHVVQAACSGADHAGDLWYWTGPTISTPHVHTPR